MAKVGFFILCDHRVNNEELYLRERERNCVDALKKAGLEVVYYKKLISSEIESVEAVRYFESEDVDCIIYYIAWFLEANLVITPAKIFNIPSIIWSVPDPKTFSLIGMGVVHGSLDEVGIKHKFIYGSINNETINSIKSFALAASVKRKLLGAKYCQIGGRALSMYTAVVDPSQWKDKFGIEVEHMEQWTLVQEAEKISDSRVGKLIRQYKEDFGQVDPSDDILLKSAKIYLALKKVFKDGKFNFVGIKCQFEMIDNYIAPCLPVSLLNDENLVTACEADMNGALTMYVLNILSNQPVSFNDVSYIDIEKKILRLLNCGSLPTSFAKSKKEIKLRNMVKGMGSFDERKGEYRTKGGACTNFFCKPGVVTIARFARIRGEYVLQIVVGEVFIPTDSVLVDVYGKDCLPWAYVKLSGDIKYFIKNIRSNHVHMVYGDFSKELLDVCNLLNVRPIVC